ncbi:CBS domain-containing protein [Siminovitchia terrae]|uniref:CBS domain-containing protein n=1 Tax=Siminovitchia terrae TaxID=1914933 RepID=UPI0028A9DE46|nr:CBS domain-containing protein [Siminovitchia terrae]
MYIINQFYHFKRALSIRELLSAAGNELIRDIKVSDVTSLSTGVDQEKAANIFRDSDLVTIPAVNQQNQLVGVVHVEDILDVMQKEATEDFHKMAPVTSLETSLKDASIFTLYRKRIAWPVVLVFMNIFSGAGIAHFEDVIESTIALVFFLPLLVDSGGNAGSRRPPS